MDNNEILKITFEKENVLMKNNYEKILQEQNEKYNQLNDLYQNEQANLEEKQQELQKELEKYKLIEKERDDLKKELESILYSRSFRFIQKCKKIIRRK